MEKRENCAEICGPPEDASENSKKFLEKSQESAQKRLKTAILRQKNLLRR